MSLNAAKLTVLTAFFALSIEASASPYFTDFNPPDYLGSNALSGQNNWDTNNYSDNGTPTDFSDDLGQSDFVGELAGYSPTTTDYWAALGGLTLTPPVVDTSFLFVPLTLAGETKTVFDVDFSITSSDTPNPARDTFGWTFRNSLGAQLLRVAFIPDAVVLTSLTIRVFDGLNAELSGSGDFSISNNSIYHLNVDVSTGGLVSVSIDDTLPAAPVLIVNNQAVAGLAPDLIGDIAATWTLSDTTSNPNGERPNFGINSLVFDNYSVVPEPSSLLLLGLGFLTLALRRARHLAN